MIDAITQYWALWICGLLSAGMITGWRKLTARQTALELGVQALLRDRIVQAYYHYAERGWITLHGLECIEAMYKEYHALGGNGTVTKLVEDIRRLEVRTG